MGGFHRFWGVLKGDGWLGLAVWGLGCEVSLVESRDFQAKV